MGYFDFLIDKDNSKPKPNMEYVYLLDMVWTPNELGDKPIKKGTIVTDVIQLENGSYEFTNKENNERLRTNYAWSLAENTPENVKRIEELDKVYLALKEQEKVVEEIRNKINTLKP